MAKEQIVQQPASNPTQARFTDLPVAEVQRSTFDRSHSNKFTFDAGRLIPFLVDEILPGDSYSVNTTMFMRLATPLQPLMDNISVDVHYFFVPNRIIWNNWQFFMGELEDPDDDPTTVTVPQGTVNLGSIEGQLADYMGMPISVGQAAVTYTFNELPFRAYIQIFNDWYRDQNFQPAATLLKGDTGSVWTEVNTNARFKRKDYFTSALPWPQKGDPVFLPLGVEAPVRGIGHNVGNNVNSTDSNNVYQAGDESGEFSTFNPWENFNAGDLIADMEQVPGTTGANFRPNVYADLQSATAATVNDIRTAFQIQKLLERDARGGTRYIEIILNHFNVQSPDFRLQRAEYLGGGSGYININPVASTVATETVPQGNLAATATGVIKAGFNHSFVEHGYLLGIVSARADYTYQNGVERMYDRKTRYDFYWPTLAHLGEQEIKQKEIFVDGTANDELTWGYQERYAEYRYKPSRLGGAMQSNADAPLDSWHLAEDFDEAPQLNAAFLRERPPIDRVVAVPTEPDFICDTWIQMTCTRPMPVYSVPGLIDHF